MLGARLIRSRKMNEARRAQAEFYERLAEIARRSAISPDTPGREN